MATAQSDDDNSWPGYVDALTTMTMMLVFIMVLLAAAIFGLSQQTSQEMIAKVAKAADIKIDLEHETVETLMQRVTRKVVDDKEVAAQVALARNLSKHAAALSSVVTMPSAAIRGETLQVASSLQSPSAPEAKAATVSKEDAMLRITFNPRSTGLDPQTEAQIEAFMRSDPRFASEKVIEVKAYAAADTGISDARRIAFHRLMNVRSRLLQIGIPSARIEAKLHDLPPGGRVDDVQVFARNRA